MKNRLLIVCAVLGLCGCRAESYLGAGSEGVDLDGEPEHGMIVLGRQLEDPYSVSNITKALVSLYPVKSSYEVPTTNLYVRFLPKTQEELEILESLDLELMDHPVDYEILRDGDYYHDPQIPAQRITWQYAVVDPDFDMPYDIRYEVLDRCYITENDVVSRADGIDWAAVERESFRLTGNDSMLEPVTRGGGSKPSGRITLVDDRYPDAPEGVKGVRVACNVFVKISQAYTDADGYYKLGKAFSAKPRYRLVFKNRKGFGIGLNTILVGGSMSSLGRHSPSGYDYEVSRRSDRALFTRCVVNNTLYDYYDSCKNPSGSIKAPPGNLRIWIFRNLSASSALMMQQGAAIDKTKIGDYLGEYATIVKWFLPDLTLGLKHCTDYASIYAMTVHELAHSSHFMQVGTDYWDKYEEFILKSYLASGFLFYGSGSEPYAGYCEVGEMWAYYMQTRLYRDRYPGSENTFGTSYWFYPQIFHYLDERGLGRFKLFQALQPSITDRNLLRDKLLALYPEFKTNIMVAFNRYY